jgi:hypothetical protein
MARRILIEGIVAEAPFQSGGEPDWVSLAVRVNDCTDVVATVDVPLPDGRRLLDHQTIHVDYPLLPADPALPGLAIWRFRLPQAPVGLHCSDVVNVEVYCEAHTNCVATKPLPIRCKWISPGQPGDDGNPDVDNGNNQNGNGGINWPSLGCLSSGLTGAMILLFALAGLAFGIALANAATINSSIGAIVFAAGLLGTWAALCPRSWCTKVGVMCWVFKWAFILSLLMLVFVTINPLIILVVVTYGSIAGLLVSLLRANGCLVPSSRLFITQLPL